MNYYLDHEKLEVYRFAIRFVVLADEIVESLPRGRAYLADQLRRAGSSIPLNIAEGAGTSVPLNIAEGAGEYSRDEKSRFYRIAKRSATECAGIFDVCRRLHLIEETQYSKVRELLIRIVSMLIKMARASK